MPSPTKSLPQRGPGLATDGSFQLAEIKLTARPRDPNAKDAPRELKLKPVFAAFEDKDQPLANAVDGKPETAWVVRANAKKDNAAVFEFEPPFDGFPGGTELDVEMKFRDLGIGRLRFSVSTEPNPATWAGDFAPQHLGEIRAIVAAGGNQLPDALTRADGAMARSVRCRSGQSIRRGARSCSGRTPAEVAGSLHDGGRRTGRVSAAARRSRQQTRQGRPRLPAGAGPRRAERIVRPAADPRVSLADWMTDAERGAGPLLARVTVNRLWQHHFGEGLVGTPNDFGAQGERPTHPELLGMAGRRSS